MLAVPPLRPRGLGRVSRIARTTLAQSAMSVIMYVKPGCPYCQAAREHLAAAGDRVEERDATLNPAWKAELMSYTNNRGVVPTLVGEDGKVLQVGFPPGRG